MFTNLFTNILLCLSLTRLLIEPKLGLKLNSLTKKTNINKLFPKSSLSCSQTTWFIYSLNYYASISMKTSFLSDYQVALGLVHDIYI